MHSIKGGMTNCQSEMKKAVECGYWNLFRFNPALKAEGKNPFTRLQGARRRLSGVPDERGPLLLILSLPDTAKELFAQNEEAAKERYEHLVKLTELYK